MCLRRRSQTFVMKKGRSQITEVEETYSWSEVRKCRVILLSDVTNPLISGGQQLAGGWVRTAHETGLTRAPRASKLVKDACGQANVPDGARGRSRDLCIRLRGHDQPRTGDAVLQVNALLFAPSPWHGPAGDGLLQDHAIDARSFCAALVCARPVLLPDCVRSDTSLGRISWLGFLFFLPFRRALPRTADLRRTGPSASSHLV